ncbi:MAG: gephyrin-like molybdotransferase Glp [Verrucomicrobiota bacterium]
MISEEEAREGILRSTGLLPARKIALQAALGCYAGHDYAARIALPIFDNSAMDGYAVMSTDCRPGARLRIIGEQPAGLDRELRLKAGEAIRIFTGAPIPQGADAVVMQEDVAKQNDEIVVNVEVESGEFIRTRGCDLSEGQKILGKGERIRETTLALLASQGIAELTVGGQVTAAILSTGDELAKAGEPLQPGQIYESNSILLQGLLERAGATVKSAEHCRDDRESLTGAIEQGQMESVLIITGGVSVGEHDLVKAALQSLGGKIDIWRVAIKPGKPFLFGRVGDCAVFGLPGNPVSAFVTFLQFVRPAILKMMGAANLDPVTVPAKLSVDLGNEGDRAHYFRGKIENGNFSPVGRQESHALFGLSQSNALLRLAPGEKFKAGAMVTAEIWD